MSESPFRRVVDHLTGGCGCACHTGIGYNAACEHCQPSTRESRTAADGAHVCPECRHWHDPDAPLVAPEAAAGSDRHGGTIRVPVEVEWRNDEAYRRGYAAGSGSLDVLLREVAASGVVHEAEPPGIDYVTIQVDPETWEAVKARAALAVKDQAHG